ncbi:Short coiled-coil protein-like protein [Operophtera brumata]|uniref:Short coiled-coil protein-like protein n=1 Tax=Operophtera brumata TaxID=104452 RepID=A0A0L7KUN1_OPEBR|nr:Short coiled-coil protein-like protein [Operophtera brumata]
MQKCNDDNIPLADDDPQVIINDDLDNNRLNHGRSMDSLPSSYTGSSSPGLNGPASFEPDSGIDEQEEKAHLSQRVDSVKEENLKLRSENQVLGQYIENLMSASSL